MPNYRRRKRNPYFDHIGDILEKVVKKNKLNLPKLDLRIREAWNASVGPLIISQTCLDQFKYGILYVKVSNSVWMQQLQFMKEEILDKLNRALEKEQVKNISFSIGPVPAESPANKPFELKSKPLNPREIRSIEQCISPIKDPELSDILKRVMLKDLQRKKS